MHKWWSLLFGTVMTAAVLLFVVAFPLGWWLPENIAIGTGNYGKRVDNLFYLILWITGFFFILTEAIMVYFLFVYAGDQGNLTPANRKYGGELKPPSLFGFIIRPLARLIHDQHRLELAWSIVPAIILIIIAVTQISAWEAIKYQSKMPSPGGVGVQQIEVSARQFEWRVRYPSLARMDDWQKEPKYAEDFSEVAHLDDIRLVNEVHTWVGQKVLVHLKTRDVIHSFYLPNLRLKQDALPGKTIRVWFQAEKANTRKIGDDWVDGDGYDPQSGKPNNPEKVWELACAELCGWGHYKMIGKLYVHETEADFRAWMEHARGKQYLTDPRKTE